MTNSPESESQGNFDKKGTTAGLIPLFLPGNTGPQITSATAMNRVVNRLNAFTKMQIKRGGSVDELIVSDANTILNLKDISVEDILVGGGGTARMFLLKSVQGDYVTAHTWDGAIEGATDLFIAKEYKLRNSLSGETIFSVAHTYAYGAGPDGNNIQRTNTDTVASVSEQEIVIPPWIVNEIIYAVEAGTGIVDGFGNPVTLQMVGRSAQWAKMGVLAIATATPASSVDTTNGYGAGLVACDGSFVYISTGVNSWARVAIASW